MAAAVPQQNDEDIPQIVAQNARQHNSGRTYRRYHSHKSANEIEYTSIYLKALSAPNLRTLIIELDIPNVTDAVFDSGGCISKVTAIMRFYRNWQRRENNNDESQPALQLPPNNRIILNSDDVDMSVFSEALHGNNNNINRNRRNSIHLNDINGGGQECLDLMGFSAIRNNHDIEEKKEEDEGNNSDNHSMEDEIEIENNNHFMEDEFENNNQNGIEMENINENNNQNQMQNNNENQMENMNQNNNENQMQNNDEHQMQNNNQNQMQNMNQNNNQNGNDRNNQLLTNNERERLLTFLNKHRLESFIDTLIDQKIRRVAHLISMSEDDIRRLGANDLGTIWAFRGLIQDIKNSINNQSPPPQQNINPPPQQNINPPPQQNINPPPQQNINPAPEQRYPAPTAAQLKDYMLKGVGCLFTMMSNRQLPTRSGHVNHEFGNKTNNNRYRQIKHYITPDKPIDSKEYKYSTASTTKAVILSGSQIGLVTITRIFDPRNNIVNSGGHWSCQFVINEIGTWYNNTLNSPENKESGWNYLHTNAIENGGYCNWWNLAAARRESVGVRALLNWSNPPNFNMNIDLSDDAIDLNEMPEPFGN